MAIKLSELNDNRTVKQNNRMVHPEYRTVHPEYRTVHSEYRTVSLNNRMVHPDKSDDAYTMKPEEQLKRSSGFILLNRNPNLRIIISTAWIAT